METAQTSENANDPCFRILRDAPIADIVKRDIWYDFEESPSVSAFAAQLERFDIDPQLKASLITARRHFRPHETVVNALKHMKETDPDLLELAEKYPAVLKAFIAANSENA